MVLSLYRGWRVLAAAGALVMTLGAAGLLSAAQQAQSQAHSAPADQAQPAPLSPWAVFQNPIPADQLSFLNNYVGQSPRFAIEIAVRD